MREQVLAALLLVAFGLIAAGASMVVPAAGLIVGGVLLAVWSWLVFGNVEVPVSGDGEGDS